MDTADLIALALLLAIPLGVLVVLRRPVRAWTAPRHDGPLGAVLGGLGLLAWITFVAPGLTEPFALAAAVLMLGGILWHLARTVQRLNRTSA
jgi:hypothetical protein